MLQTETRAGAEISFNSGSVVSVRPDSVVYIGGSAESSTAAWRVQSGRVNFSVGDETTEIVTPTVRTTALQNASGNIDVTDAGETGVKVFRGQAEVETTPGPEDHPHREPGRAGRRRGQGGRQAGPAAAADARRPRGKGQAAAGRPPEASARLSWNAVQNGVTYRVAMDYNVTQANLLLSAALDEPGVTGTSHDLKGLGLGRYFWRVSAVNKDGLEGAFSRVSSFAVVEPEKPQPPTPTPGVAPPVLVLQALDEVAPGVVHVGGRTDPGATLLVNGTAVKVMPDGSFSEYVRRSGPGEVVIRATGADGQVAEQARAVSKR